MRTDRREFLHMSLAAGALLAAGTGACSTAARREEESAGKKMESVSKKKLDILILGGTGFLGPALVEVARTRGHALTLFNRGKTNTHLFPEIERIQGDRDPKKGEGVKGLEGRKFDVVFDDSGYYPRHVTATAELAAKNDVGHYVYVSSISCYAETGVEGLDETAKLATIEDPTVETMGEGYANYGALKALCEQAAEKTMPDRTTVIRPGYIVGPGDPTDRFTYWPVRFDKGGTILVPGAPTDPLQVIDVRDLAAFMVCCAENRTLGRFNACGPAQRMSWGETLDACKACSSAQEMKLVWLPVEKMEELKDTLLKDVGFPIWAPYTDETKGFHTWSNARAIAAGLTFRPIKEICRDTLAWWKTLPVERQKRMVRQFDPAKEAEILKSMG